MSHFSIHFVLFLVLVARNSGHLSLAGITVIRDAHHVASFTEWMDRDSGVSAPPDWKMWLSASCWTFAPFCITPSASFAFCPPSYSGLYFYSFSSVCIHPMLHHAALFHANATSSQFFFCRKLTTFFLYRLVNSDGWTLRALYKIERCF